MQYTCYLAYLLVENMALEADLAAGSVWSKAELKNICLSLVSTNDTSQIRITSPKLYGLIEEVPFPHWILRLYLFQKFSEIS